MTTFRRLVAFFSIILIASFLGCASTPTQEGTGEFFDDSVITAKIKTALIGEESLKSFDIKVVTFKGRVQLSGFVGSQAEMSKAIELARKVRGVVDVKNDMRLK